MQRWTRTVLASLLAILACCAAVVFVADPYQKYRAATWFTPDYYNGEEGYNNAGLALHYDYDAVIIGTSMVENTKPSLVDATFGTHSIKLPFEGGMASNHSEVLNLALSSHEVREVFYGMDMYSFVRKPSFSNFMMPHYLYDGNPFSDIKYLLNGDMLFHRIPSLIWRNARRTAPAPTRDEMYAGWGANSTFSAAYTLESYDFTLPAVPMLPADAFADNVRANFARYVQPYLKNYPNTRFTFFFPPYSSLQWYKMQQEGHLEAVLRTKELLTELLLPYANARLFDFTANLEWIENLDLYTDYSHYSPVLNDRVVAEMAKDTFLVHAQDQVLKANETLRSVAANFPVPGN